MRARLWVSVLVLWCMGATWVHAQQVTCPNAAKGFDPVAAEVITASTTAVSLSSNIITTNQAAGAYITMEGTTGLRYALVGIPTATTGHLIDPPSTGNSGTGTGSWFCGRASLLALRMIRAGAADVIVRVTYYQVHK